jgi:FlaA1/EpsC-like NDP-sugar epimerase
MERLYHVTGEQNGVVLVPVLFALTSAAVLTGLRVLRRALAWRTSQTPAEGQVRPRRTLIVGAGDAGETILRELTRGRHPSHQVVGFIDDSPEKQALRIHGISVLGTVEDIPKIAEHYRVDEILIAMPTASGSDIRRVYDNCSKTIARVRTLPGLRNLLSGDRLAKHLRDIDIEDLLRREPVSTNMEEISRYLRGEHVLITGGGGSIGSELARQVAQMSPATLILVGKGENSIYDIEQ